LLLNAEKFAVASLLGRKYPSEEFDQGWKDLLFDDLRHFRDQELR
jgi:hypothetical protein